MAPKWPAEVVYGEFDNNLQVGNMKEWDEEGILEYHGIYSYGKMDSLVYKRQHLVTE